LAVHNFFHRIIHALFMGLDNWVFACRVKMRLFAILDCLVLFTEGFAMAPSVPKPLAVPSPKPQSPPIPAITPSL
jgi:hypothetical protein